MKEIRKHSRHPTAFLMTIRSTDLGPGMQGRAYSVDLSETGAGFESEAKLEKDRRVFMELQIPLEVIGRVAHVETRGVRFRYGIKFDSLGWLDRWFLRRYLRKLAREKSI